MVHNKSKSNIIKTEKVQKRTHLPQKMAKKTQSGSQEYTQNVETF